MAELPLQTLAQWLKLQRQQLSTVSQTPDIDARLCLCHVLGVSNSYLYSYPERQLSISEMQQLDDIINRRLQGQPLAYVFGHWNFFGLTLQVSSATLIPRPDTEVLVERVLALSLPQHCQVLDLGTGTGAIALALAHSRPQWQVTAVDYIAGAVALAQSNCQALKLTNCQVMASNWYSSLQHQRFDVIVSNPPYIDPQDPHLAALQFEPISALTAPQQGLADIKHIIAHAADHLQQGGWLWLEHGYDQAAAVRALLQQAGFSHIASAKDYGDNWRISGGQFVS